jgi:Domain of unknown function (DUF4129)
MLSPIKRLLHFCLLVCALALLTASALAAPAPMTLQAYWQKLNDTHALAVRLQGATPDSARPHLLAAADEWAAITSVTLADGTPAPIDNSFLVAQLRADPPQPAQVAALTQTLLVEGAAWPAPRHSAGDLDSLGRILARPEFQWPSAQPTWLDQLRQRLWAWFQRLVTELLSRVGVGGPGGIGLGDLLAVVAVLAVAGILVYALLGLFQNFAAEARAPEDPGLGDESLTAEAASRRAQTLSDGGDYRAAVRYLYLSALLHLEEAGLLRYDRSLTNREYLRSLAGMPELAARLQRVVEVVDRVWYGYDALDTAAYADYSARVADLRDQK